VDQRHGCSSEGGCHGDDFVGGWVGDVGRLQRLRCGEARAKRFAPPRGSSTSYTRGERGVRGDRHRCHRGKGKTEEVLRGGKEEFCSCGQPLMLARMWPWQRGRVAGGARRCCKDNKVGDRRRCTTVRAAIAGCGALLKKEAETEKRGGDGVRHGAHME
jgi:hypothetical protein